MDFTETAIWRQSMFLAVRVVALTRRLPVEERFGMRSQLTRCATSVPSNVAEGWVRESWKEKVRFLSIAHGSLAELKTQLLLCAEVNWLERDDIGTELDVADQIAKMITTLKKRWRQPPGAQRAPTIK